MSKAGDKAKEAEKTKENTGTVDCVSDCEEKNPKDPCEHLESGGQRGGPLRGGSYSKTIGTRNKTESNHLVPKTSGSHVLSKWKMPAAQMPINDHYETENWGSSHDAKIYQEKQKSLVTAEKWRDSTANGIRNMRRVSKYLYGQPNEFNKKVLEALEYQKCLEEHGILPGKLKKRENGISLQMWAPAPCSLE